MNKLLTILTAAGLLLSPLAASAQDYGSQPMQNPPVPPLAQALVREGDFAIKLAAILDIGTPQDEAAAEDMLARAGVVPVNGWLSDYPVTPEILGQLQNSVAKAASEGRLTMTSEQATRGLYSLASEMNLPTPAESGASAAPAGASLPSNSATINNYYSDQGPPIITYYEPPVDYAYLYAWVPYPVWWFGFWFPGFYICHNFTTTVIVRGGHDEWHHRAIVSNRVVDPVSHRAVFVDPVTRTGRGSLRAMTILRTGSGRTFANLAEFRRDVQSGRERTGAVTGPVRTGGFRSADARKGASAIYSRSLERAKTGAATGGTRGERSWTVPAPSRSVSAPPVGSTMRQDGGSRLKEERPMERNTEPMVRAAPAPLEQGRERSFEGRGQYRMPEAAAPSMPQRAIEGPAARAHTYSPAIRSVMGASERSFSYASGGGRGSWSASRSGGRR